MLRLQPAVLQQLWDLHAGGASIRRIASSLRISRNTVRRHVRGAVHGSSFPPAPEPERVWAARARAIIAADPRLSARAVAVALRAEGLEVSLRSIQRELARWRQDRSQTLDSLAGNQAFQPVWDLPVLRQVS